MHDLHKILVYIPNCVDRNASLKEQKEEIRSAAECGTEDFFDVAFDWRETDSAGRWKEDYPEQVYFASDDIEWFTNELIEVKNRQKEDIENCLAQLKNTVGLDLKAISEKIDEQGDRSFPAYYLLHLSELLYGKYNYDSGFYNLRDATAKISNDIIEEIRSHPNDWALVMFDYHN